MNLHNKLDLLINVYKIKNEYSENIQEIKVKIKKDYS